MPHKTRKSYFLHHSCLISAVIVIGSPKNVRNGQETLAGSNEILGYIQAEGRKFISYKKACRFGS